MGENYRFLKRHRWLLLLIKSSGKSKLQGAVYERALRRKENARARLQLLAR